MPPANVMDARCPSRVILNHLTSKWGVLILIALRQGTLRFSELRRRIDGVSERMLAQTLQLLEEDGMVQRKSYETVPPHVEYSLTDMGMQAADKVHALVLWVEGSYPEIARQRDTIL